jgi:hypothetical protein
LYLRAKNALVGPEHPMMRGTIQSPAAKQAVHVARVVTCNVVAEAVLSGEVPQILSFDAGGQLANVSFQICNSKLLAASVMSVAV